MPGPPTDREALIAILAGEARADAGGQPAPEELLDFLAGRLDPEEESRVSRRLMASPEASRALLDLADLEAAGAAAGERPRELGTAAAWRDFERRLPGTAPRPRRLWTLLPSIAAAALLVSTLGLSAWVWRLQDELSRPSPNPRTAQLGTMRAADPSFALAPGQQLRLLLRPAAICPVYAAELAGPKGRKTIEGLKRDPLGNVSLILPRPKPGTYTLRLDGCGSEPEELSFRVTVDDG